MKILIKIPNQTVKTDEFQTETTIDLQISLEELSFLRHSEPVAWAALMAGLERLGFVIAAMPHHDNMKG